MSRFNDFDRILAHYELTGVHEACAAMPEQNDADWQVFCQSMSMSTDAVTVDIAADRRLLDGRHRLLWCFEHNRPVDFRVIEGDAWAHVYKENVAIRQLGTGL